MITKLELRNFTTFEKLDIDFSPRINVIIGENGTGKTQLLKMLMRAYQEPIYDKEHNRSMNADIVARLEQSFEKDDAAEFDKGFVLQVIESQQDQINQLQKMIQDLMNQLRGSKE